MTSVEEADVVIIGGGLAGLSAGGRLTLGGLRVMLLETGTDEQYMCNSRIAGGSYSLAHSDPTADPSFLRDAILGDTEGYADPRLAEAIAMVAGDAMKWLRSEGAKFIKIQRANSHARWSMAPPRPPKPASHLVRETWDGRGPDHVLRCLTKGFKNRGGKIYLGTQAMELLFEAGRCRGVEASCNGAPRIFRANHVLIADGGFQANLDLLKRFIGPHPEQFTQRNARTGHGDGLLMAERAGAALTRCDRFYGHLLAQESATIDELWPWPTLDTLSSSAIIVDRSGRRFIDEGIGGIPMVNAIAQMEDPLCATSIFDQTQWETVGRLEHTPPNPLLVDYGGTVSSANTLEELAVMIGVPAPALVETLRVYNGAIESDRLDKLDPPRSPGRMFGTLRSSEKRLAIAPIQKAPFHGVRLRPGITYTMGGIAIDARARVLNKSGQPMPGLYAAGACTGGVEGGPVAGYVGGLNKALTLGYIAARSMIEETATRAA